MQRTRQAVSVLKQAESRLLPSYALQASGIIAPAQCDYNSHILPEEDNAENPIEGCQSEPFPLLSTRT